MACLLVVFLLAFPRIALLLICFLSNYLERVYHGLLIPLLGFVFLPKPFGKSIHAARS
jgi:hypothetical protein